MKFKSNIEIQAGLEDASGSPGTVNQLLSSTATGTAWIDPSTIVAEAATLVVIACKNTSGATIAQGTPVYQTGTVGATATIEIAPADALISANKLPAIGLLQTALNNNGFGFVVITGELTNFITSPIDGVVPTTGDKVFVKSGGGLTLTKPTGEGNGIQNMGLVGKVSTGNSGSITVSSIMRTNDVPNLPEGRIWVGDGNTIVSDTVYVDEPNNRFGIGTTNPLQPFQVDAGSSIASFRSVGTGENNKELLIQTGGDRVTLDAKNADDGTATSLSFELGNSEKARLTTTGLGIGTTSPQAKLDVDGDTFLASRHIKISGTGINTYFTAATHDSSGTEGLLNKLSIKSVGTFFDHGALAITNTAVAEPLDTTIVQETISSGDTDWNVLTLPKESGTFALENWVTSNFAPSTGGSYLPLSAGSGSPLTGDLYIEGADKSLRINNGTQPVVFLGDGGANTDGQLILYNSTGGVNVVFNGDNQNHYITNGNVGIGTNSPAYQLTLGGNAVGSTEGLRINDPSNALYGAHFSFSDTPNEVWIGGVTNNTYNSAIGIHREATRAITIDVDSNVGIGTTSPGTALHVVSGGIGVQGTTGATALTAPGIWMGSDGTNALIYGRQASTWKPTYLDSSALYINAQSGGNVGIGTTSPSEKLDVAGNIKLSGVLYIGSRGIYQQQNTDVSGLELVANASTSLYRAAFFDYVIQKQGNVRAGTVFACNDGTSVEYTETSTNDIGDTSDVVLSVDISGTNMRLLADAATSGWSVKSLIRAI